MKLNLSLGQFAFVMGVFLLPQFNHDALSENLTHDCESHPTAPTCPGSEAYCSTHVYEEVCSTSNAYCSLYPYAPTCRSSQAYCNLNPDAETCPHHPAVSSEE
jgi:hypothetical protein